MGTLHFINPILHHPWGVVFHQPDEFNGHQRGEHWFRHPHTGVLRGPFHGQEDAEHTLEAERYGFSA